MFSSSELVFGDSKVEPSLVFYQRKQVFALVNDKPLFPGHVIVVPIKEVRRLKDVSEVELLELIFSVKSIASNLKRFYETESVVINVQDGKEAGQSTKHVCFHIYPLTEKADYKEATGKREILKKSEAEQLALSFQEKFVFK